MPPSSAAPTARPPAARPPAASLRRRASGGETSGGEASAARPRRRGLGDEASGDEAPAPDAPARRGGAPDGAADGSSSSDGDSSGFDDDDDDDDDDDGGGGGGGGGDRDAAPRFRCLGLADALLPRGDPRSDAVPRGLPAPERRLALPELLAARLPRETRGGRGRGTAPRRPRFRRRRAARGAPELWAEFLGLALSGRPGAREALDLRVCGDGVGPGLDGAAVEVRAGGKVGVAVRAGAAPRPRDFRRAPDVLLALDAGLYQRKSTAGLLKLAAAKGLPLLFCERTRVAAAGAKRNLAAAGPGALRCRANPLGQPKRRPCRDHAAPSIACGFAGGWAVAEFGTVGLAPRPRRRGRAGLGRRALGAVRAAPGADADAAAAAFADGADVVVVYAARPFRRAPFASPSRPRPATPTRRATPSPTRPTATASPPGASPPARPRPATRPALRARAPRASRPPATRAAARAGARARAPARRRRLQRRRDWYHPATYELRCGAEALAALRHAEAHPGAWWISKPRAGSRGQGVRVDASLARAPSTRPARVAQRYVRDVALYRGRKFDVRFLVLVRRLEGDALCGRLWRDFWAGIKQRDFWVRSRDAYGGDPSRRTAHLTAMHLVAPATFDASANPTAAEFREFYERETGGRWSDALGRVRALARDVLAAGAARCPGFSTAAAEGPPRRAAVYGIDVLFDREWTPVLLEVQFDPVPKPGLDGAALLAGLLLDDDATSDDLFGD
ncbi:ATP binding protein [Aureococcus anophagefferens]|nr:ATP binding protein [Aureococcus anophagefferens]